MADKDRKFGEGGSDKDDAFGSGDASDFGALTGGDSGLGNLPPLSDFESSAGKDFESGLPPLSGIDAGPSKDRGSIGGLPPISDIPVETPIPTGGNIKIGSTPSFGTPSRAGLDTPSHGSSFQDLAADSDFTPETPEMAPPGPESDIDTPLFDSAFGGQGTFSGAADTSAPTQAMETPMFGASPVGFDADAFTGATNGGGGFDAGTPLPDFGPDTAAPTAVTPAPVAARGVGPVPPSRGGMGTVTVIGIAAGVLIVGLVGGGFLANYIPLPYPIKSELADANKQIKDQKAQIDKMLEAKGDKTPLTKEEIDKLIKQKTDLDGQITEMTSQRDSLQADVTARTQTRDEIVKDIDQKNAEFVQAQESYEQLVNATAVQKARKEGLEAERDRLETLVGKLDDANQRRVMTKETLDSNIDRLKVQIAESSPLAPDKYSREARLARVDALKQKAAGINWVDPPLLDEYSSLYVSELEIADSREYFFAKIPVKDRFGTPNLMWAECLMNGNWSVYYRTLDGAHTGVYQNAERSGGPARYEFVDMSDAAAKQIEAEVFKARPAGYEEKLEQIAHKQLMTNDKTQFQKAFDSL